MKKTVALLLALLLSFSLFGVIVSADDFSPILRFAVFTDIHIAIADDYLCEKLKNAISYAYDYSGSCEYNKLDAIVCTGDIGNDGEDFQWEAAKDVFLSNTQTDETALMVLMGNHEFHTDPDTAHDRYVKVFKGVNGGGNAKVLDTTLDDANMHMTVNGIHFIGISPDSNEDWAFAYSDDKIKWMDEQLKIAESDTGKGKPIFTFHHIGCDGTVLGTEPSSNSPKQFGPIYSQYPQLVNFTGHSHFPINNEYSIWQGDFTALNAGAFKYAAVSIFNDIRVDYFDKADTAVDQFYIVEVNEKGATRITMHDVDEHRTVGETYLIDSYNSADFKYRPERLLDKPFDFPEDATLKVNSASAHKINFTFTPVQRDNLSATAYHIEIIDTDGKSLNNQYLGWAYYDESEENQTVDLGSIIPGMKEGVEYTLYVDGVNSGFQQLIDDTTRYTDSKLSIKFHFGELIEEESETDAEPEEKPDIAPQEETQTGVNPWLIVGIAIAAAAIIAVIVFTVIKFKRGKNK